MNKLEQYVITNKELYSDIMNLIKANEDVADEYIIDRIQVILMRRLFMFASYNDCLGLYIWFRRKIEAVSY